MGRAVRAATQLLRDAGGAIFPVRGLTREKLLVCPDGRFALFVPYGVSRVALERMAAAALLHLLLDYADYDSIADALGAVLKGAMATAPPLALSLLTVAATLLRRER